MFAYLCLIGTELYGVRAPVGFDRRPTVERISFEVPRQTGRM